MSKPDKHTPLSAEELFKLLENNAGKGTDFEGMDDFEKEALEGFANHSTPEKTRAMVEEMNLAVSKKVTSETSATKDEEPGTKKNRVIWFSAAASIVLLVIISMFFLNQSKTDTASNVALNDIASPPTVQPAIVAPGEDMTVAPEPVDETGNATGPASAGKARVSEEYKEDMVSRVGAQETKPGTEAGNGNVFAEAKTFEESEKNMNTATFKGNVEAKDALKKSEDETADKLAAVKPAAVPNIQAETANAFTSPASGSTNMSSAPVTIQYNAGKYDAKVATEKAGKNVDDERSAKKSKAREKAPAYATADSEMDQEIETAYYKGGELAIKEYVVAWLQKSGLTVTGKYKVKANVLTNGALKVKLVNHITTETCKDCENILKKALNEMTGWTPAMWGKTASESSVDFVLSF